MDSIPWPLVAAVVAVVLACCAAVFMGMRHDGAHSKPSDPDDYSNL